MTNSTRKEPTFGEPTPQPENTNVAQASENTPKTTEKTVPNSSVSFSLHSKQAPSYTFTPPLVRPANTNNELKTFEETRAESAQATPEPTEAVSAEPVQNVSEVENASTNEEKTTQSLSAVETENTETPTRDEQPALKAEPMTPKAPAVVNNIAKYRRLLLVAIAVIILLFIFFLLKPKTPNTVEELQQQGNALPIEFRPVDEEEAKRAEEEAKRQAAAQQAAMEQQAKAEQAAAQEQAVQQPQQPQANIQQSVPAVEQPAPGPVEPASAVQPTVVAPVARPVTQGSVIHQPESVQPRQETAKAQPKAVEPRKVERVTPPAKPVAQPKAETAVKTPAKPATQSAEKANNSNANGVVSSKSMTVPKGVSLMQVFRNHNLNISDVNAMSKANNAVGNLKVGEQVTVRLDKNNRVVEMSIGSGGRYIRQANGSYTFKK